MTLHTFNIDAEVLQANFPQLRLGGEAGQAMLDDNRIAEIVRQRSGRISGIYGAAGLDLAEIEAAGEEDPRYQLARYLLVCLCIPTVAYGFSGLGGGLEDAIQDARDEARDMIARLSSRPEEADPGSDASPGVATNLPSDTSDVNSLTRPRRRWASNAAYPMRW